MKWVIGFKIFILKKKKKKIGTILNGENMPIGIIIPENLSNHNDDTRQHWFLWNNHNARECFVSAWSVRLKNKVDFFVLLNIFNIQNSSACLLLFTLQAALMAGVNHVFNQFTVETLYNTINFCWSTHKRHSIARPKGRGMGCLLWVQRATYFVDLSLLSSMKYLL